ncbi:hypothetical protein Q3G72_016172 [Acer saccharum]|nr:hypothetical protein Q3G72_016172 [Acer saccharum]
MSFDATNQESGLRIEFGCFCKVDLAAAHKHCAEAWIKIKGNKPPSTRKTMLAKAVATEAADLQQDSTIPNTHKIPSSPTPSSQHLHLHLQPSPSPSINHKGDFAQLTITIAHFHCRRNNHQRNHRSATFAP